MCAGGESLPFPSPRFTRALGLRDRTQAAVLAYEAHLVEPRARMTSPRRASARDADGVLDDDGLRRNGV